MVQFILIALASGVVFWAVGRAWPRIRQRAGPLAGRILPWLVSPIAFSLLKRAIWLAVRFLLFRR